MTRLNALAGTFQYEFRMQIKRPVVWILILTAGLLVGGWLNGAGKPTDSAVDIVARRTYSLTLYLPVIVGILLTDRLPRERRLNVRELLDSLPTSRGSRLWGKYLGAVAGTALPVLLVYLIEIAYVAIRRQDASLLPLELPAFALVTLPGLLFVGAFSIACTEVLPPPLYSILFIGYWFWGNVVQPSRMPTLTCTLLSPSGVYAKAGLLRATITPGSCPNEANITALQGWASIALLLALAASVMLAVQAYLTWRAAHQ